MPSLNVNALLSPSVNVSTNVNPVRVVFPVFSTVIVNVTWSPAPVLPFPLSKITGVLVTSIEDTYEVLTIVGSFVGSSSASSPSVVLSPSSL